MIGITGETLRTIQLLLKIWIRSSLGNKTIFSRTRRNSAHLIWKPNLTWNYSNRLCSLIKHMETGYETTCQCEICWVCTWFHFSFFFPGNAILQALVLNLLLVTLSYHCIALKSAFHLLFVVFKKFPRSLGPKSIMQRRTWGQSSTLHYCCYIPRLNRYFAKFWSCLFCEQTVSYIQK